jgi:hypothetical protein
MHMLSLKKYILISPLLVAPIIATVGITPILSSCSKKS